MMEKLFFLVYVFENISWPQKIFFISTFFLFFGVVYSILSVLIFNFYMLPKIEKLIGKKIKFFNSYASFFPFGVFLLKERVVSSYIINRYRSHKSKNEDMAERFNPEYLPLKESGYVIKMMSKCDIFLSYLSRLIDPLCFLFLCITLVSGIWGS